MILQVAQQLNNDQLLTGANVGAIGKIFRQAREEKKLTIEDVARITHIRRLYLSSIESGDLNQLPGGIYTVGFIKTYATFLELDAPDILRQLGMDAVTLAEANSLVVPIPRESQERPQLKLVAITSAIALVVLGGAYFWQEGKLSLPIQEEKTQIASIQSATQELPVEEIKEGEAEPALAETQSFLAEQEEHSGLPDNKLPATPSQPLIKNNKGVSYKVSISADKDSWVQVVDGQGKNVFVRLMHAGEVFEIPSENPPYKLNTGNAAGIRIRLNDETTKALGAEGKVLRGISLDPENIKQMSLSSLVPVSN